VATAAVEPLKVIRTVEPRFPDALLARGIYEGEARVVLLVDADGRLADWLLTSYSHPYFAREATEALRQWRFEVARRDGQPIEVRTEMVFSFQASGMVVSLSASDLAERFQRLGEDRSTRKLCRPNELDRPITPTRTVAPLWPAGWPAPMKEARAVLDFYIDEEGRPRMPVVTQSDDDALNFAAVEALSHWRFQPPTRKGLPVLVRATQPFRFYRRG
jgi:TonB family protein